MWRRFEIIHRQASMQRLCEMRCLVGSERGVKKAVGDNSGDLCKTKG
jgi:hypothetical protein